MEVSSLLVFWYKKNGRLLPWRLNSDAYRIWLSEIILQQTRVEQGLNYYLQFVKSYPTVFDLAAAPLDEVLKLWQGLGYYTRARNLHLTAKNIAEHHGGNFPANLSALKKLRGVGDYTAAAIASMAFGIPAAVVDGNVYRVLSRCFGIGTPIDSTEGRREFQALAQELIDVDDPGGYNQAIMDLGALVCTPQLAKCDQCPLSTICHACAKGMISSLPVKSIKVKVATRYFHYLIIKDKNRVMVRQRQGKDIWHSLYEFPLICTESQAELEEISQSPDWLSLLAGTKPCIEGVSELIKHRLTHQIIVCRFYLIRINVISSELNRAYQAIEGEKLYDLSVSKLIDNYISRDNVKIFITNND